jgi:purine-binding chemotaxis protein CheW
MEPLQALGTRIRFESDGRQYLTFALGGQEYGIDILNVLEIKGCAPITPIPNTPAHVKGVMNLRGTIIPVIDLRAKLGMREAEYGAFTVIVVVRVGPKVIGLVVDAVSDVLNIPESDIQPTPDFGKPVDARFIEGMAKAGDRLVILLGVAEVLGGDVKEAA